MSLLDEFKTQGAEFRLTEETLYAEVYKEMEAGIKRDGLWTKALAESKFDELTAKSLYIKYRVQSLRDEISNTNLGKISNSALLKKLLSAPLPRHNKRIDKDLTCNRCGYFGKMTWTRGTTIPDKFLVFMWGSALSIFLLMEIVIPIQKYLTQGIEDNRTFLFALLMFSNMAITFTVVYLWISKFIVTCPKCKKKGQVFSDIK